MARFIISILLVFSGTVSNYNLPINTFDRKSINALELTAIGEFGLLRKERPGVPAHYHTGIDIKRPTNNYQDEPIFPIAEGRIISKRQDGPYAQLIIEHHGETTFWTIYEHIAGIRTNLHDYVSPDAPIARFMNKKELDRYGWQFDHFHFEILKVPPVKLRKDATKPDRLFASYTLTCHTKEDLNKYFYNPLTFLGKRLN